MLRLRGSTLLLYNQVIIASTRGHILTCKCGHEMFGMTIYVLLHSMNAVLS